MSKERLASHLGVTIQAINKVVGGKTAALSAPNNSKAARFLGVDADWLAIGEGSRISQDAWPFKHISLAELHELEKTSPGALAHIETTALGLLSLAKTPTNVKKDQMDTIGDSQEEHLTVFEGKLPSTEGQQSAASSSARNHRPGQRRKRMPGNS